MPNEDKVQRDLYSAFLIQNADSTLTGFDDSELDRKYDSFKTMHDAKIARLSMIHAPSSTGVKWAV